MCDLHGVTFTHLYLAGHQMSGQSATRNTCFAIISAIEEDFRTLCIGLGDAKSLLPEDVLESSGRRRSADLRMNAEDTDVSEAELLPYIDFADIAKIIESKIAPRHLGHKDWLIHVARRLISLTATRNRVCHTRPLETSDLPSLIDFSDELINPGTPYLFPSVAQTRQRLQNEPSFVLTVQIPIFWAEKSKIHHNLPLPEFDDTGFLGRQPDRLQVLKLIKSHYPVVTIVGEGGIGKTALALRCLYDILDEQDGFDAIIWISLKNAALTAAGVRNLNGAITDTLGLFSELAKQLGVVDIADKSVDHYINEIAEYMGLYRILIAIDNLETISVGPLRELLLRVPSTSKVLLTSRIGLGEFEARYPLQGLEEKAAISLIRAHAKVMGVTILQRFDEGNLKGFCRKLFFNPLLIKWFVAGVSHGGDPNTLLSKSGETFAEAISFCFQNLYDRFGESERSVIGCLASARRPLTTAELHFVRPSVSTLELETALVALHNSSIVVRAKKGSDSFEYSLTDSTTAFIDHHAPPSAEFFKDVQSRLRDLRAIFNHETMLEDRYEYDAYYVRSGTSRDERVCATYLRRALDSLRTDDVESARSSLEEPRRLAPQSGEVWRIMALVEEASDNQYKAFQYYQESIDLDSNSRIARYSFGLFLMNDMDELEGAIEQFDAALKLDPDHPTLLTAKAMALNRSGKFSESAAIHEVLLGKIAERERRWRLTGTDQAADCYRRWGFRAWELREYAMAKERFKRAMTIISDSNERGDLDDKLIQLICRIITESLRRRELSEDIEFVEFIISSAENIQNQSGKSIPISLNARFAVRALENNTDLQTRLINLDKRYADTEAFNRGFLELSAIDDHEADGRRMGAVHNLQQSFGFIAERDGSRWFFHRNSLRSNLAWDDLQPGFRVSFLLGFNEKGECAVDIASV